jgi:hypothetical protein
MLKNDLSTTNNAHIDWLSERQKYVTASQIPDILSVYLPDKYGHLSFYEDWRGNKRAYTSKYYLLHEKLLNPEQLTKLNALTKNANTTRGLKNEQAIINLACEKLGFTPVESNKILFNKDNLASTPDAILIDPITNDKITLEVKNPNLIDNSRLERYKLQVQVQLYTTECLKGYLFVKSENQESILETIILDKQILNDIQRATEMFNNDLFKLKNNLNAVLPDETFEKDVIMKNIVDTNFNIANIEEAAAAYIHLKDFAKRYEKAQEFLKQHIDNEYTFNNVIIRKEKANDIIWTQHEIDDEIIKLQKNIAELPNKINTKKRAGNVSLKVINN